MSGLLRSKDRIAKIRVIPNTDARIMADFALNLAFLKVFFRDLVRCLRRIALIKPIFANKPARPNKGSAHVVVPIAKVAITPMSKAKPIALNTMACLAFFSNFATTAGGMAGSFFVACSFLAPFTAFPLLTAYRGDCPSIIRSDTIPKTIKPLLEYLLFINVFFCAIASQGSNFIHVTGLFAEPHLMYFQRKIIRICSQGTYRMKYII